MPDPQISMRGRMNFHNDNALKLGLFGANCSSGRALTLAPDRWSGSWQDNLRMAQLADDAGFDFLLPIARWKGSGGITDFQGATLETVTWATGLLAKTRRISVFATMHVPLFHPIIAAKEMVTADHIGEGRFGLNLVVGWNEDEFDMFGVSMREHAARYEYAQEWIDSIKRMWSEDEPFDFDGTFLKLKKVSSKPKPYGGSRPMIMNAGASASGNAFALRNCDAFFKGINQMNFDQTAAGLRDFRAQARQNGRDVDTYITGTICCRPTRAEAEAFIHNRLVEQADWSTIEGRVRLTPDFDKKTPEEQQAMRTYYMNGYGLQIVGNPDDVAAELAKLHAAGLTGIALTLFDYAGELPYLAAELMPRLERMGLRVKPSA